jgi:hypothetical protein
MFRYAVATLLVPTTCFAIQHGTQSSLRLEPGWIVAMTAIVLAQLMVAQLRSQWETKNLLIEQSPSD